MHAGQDVPVEDAGLPDPVGGPASAAEPVLGTDASPSPAAVADGTAPVLEVDRLDVGTPLADLGTEQVSPR